MMTFAPSLLQYNLNDGCATTSSITKLVVLALYALLLTSNHLVDGSSVNENNTDKAHQCGDGVCISSSDQSRRPADEYPIQQHIELQTNAHWLWHQAA